VTVLVGVIASGSLGLAQGSQDRAIDQAQRAVSQRITSQEGGRDLAVQFGRDARTEFPSNTGIRVRGTGTVTRSADGTSRPFSYEAVVNTRNGNVSAIRYDWRGDWYSSGRRAVTNRLTGTYRLNPARSDDASTTAGRVTRNLPAGQQERLRTAVMRRLEAPESLAIERDGRAMTIASSTAAQVSFEADGREQIEQSRNGRQVRTTATLSGDRLVVTTEGDRAVDYQVTFESIDNGRRLRVTRRITHEDLRQAVVAASVYDKTSDTPQWDVYAGARRARSSTDAPGGGFIVPDGTEVVAALNDVLSTKQARDGDRFTLTVRAPAQYASATIEGSLAGVARSGQVSGRAEMSFEFETIRLRNGRVYNFAGSIDSVRTPNGDPVRVDTEGTVEDEGSQTGRTVTRTGIGAAIGAVIGAVAGGGKGAAIGAAVGAGAGAGSVFIQGRGDLDLMSGTEFRIRASTPR
jgi:hypothetical protein